MSITTIQIPSRQVSVVRKSLLAIRRDLIDEVSPSDLDRLIAQTAAAVSAGEPASVTASRSLLWTVFYDVLCQGAERFADECNEYWRRADPAVLRAEIGNLGTISDLLAVLGAPPDGRRVSAGRRGGEVAR